MAKSIVKGGVRQIHGPDASLDPWPIPKDQILSGNPVAKGTVLWQSDDKRLLNGIWECAPGSFTWEYTWDETIYVTEGELTITDDSGATTKVKAGDLIYVPTGTKSTWKITKHVRKAYHIRSSTPVNL